MTSKNRKPIWTNSPEWQDQETGETTTEGMAHLQRKGQHKLMEENMAKFAKKTATEGTNDKAEKADKADKASKKEKAPKADKAAKGGKPAKGKAEKKEKTGGGRTSSLATDTRKITVLVKENPKREGTKAFDKFQRYFKSKTVADFAKLGGTSVSLNYDIEKGYIKVA